MKKIDFSAIHKSIFLMLFMMIAFVGFSQGTDDFNTATTSTSYTSFTTTGGWSCVNTAVFAQTSTYSMGTCERNYVVINGKTSAVGAINSPELTGGCGSLSFSFGNIFSESNGASFHVTVTGSNSSFDTTVTVANSDMEKGANLLFTADVNIEGDFTIAIANLSPSQSTSNKDRLAIGCIEWTAYGDVPVVTVAAPTFDPEGGNYFAAQNVTLASATEGAIIYYTVDGTTPTIESLLYQGPIAVSENTTIKAIAILGEDESSVATANYNIPVEVATIEAFKEAEHDNNTIYKITGDVKVLGQYDNKKYTFIQDMGQGTYAALCIYDNNGSNINTYNPGDVISGGVYGKYKNYNGLVELVPVEGLPSAEGTPGEPIAPDVRTLDNVLAYYDWFEGKLVTIKGLTFTESQTFGTTTATKGAIATQGENTIKVYNTLGTITGVEVSEGMTADVTGYIIRYGEDIEIAPRGSEDIVEVVGPAVAPWTATFEDALENSAWDINNGTSSNKWYIGQAQGFDNNKLYISSNNGVTNKYIAEYSYVEASRAIVIPQNGGVLSFDYRANGNDNDYVQVAIVKEGGNRTNLATLHGANDWTSATYTIAPDMAGEATLVFLWTNQPGNANQFPAAIDNVSLVASSCSQPTALQPTVEETTATISWTGDAEAYLLQYKLADHSEWYSVNTTENTVVLNNLQGNSNYNVRVKSVCGDDASAWVEGNFVVDCQNLIVDTHRDYKVIGTEAGASTYSYIPFYGLYNYAYSQQIVDANEINATSGTIYSVSFKCSSAPASTSTGGIRIWLANTDKATFSSNTDYINPSELTEVYVGPSSYAYQSGWNEFVLTTPFEYTGGNLVVAYYEGNSSYSSSSFYVNSKEGSKAIYHYNDDGSKVSYTDPASNTGSKGVTAYRNVMKFDMDVVTEICGDVEACPAVTNVQVNNITPNSAELTWAAGSEDETLFNVEYYAEGSSMIQSVQVEGTSYTLSGLSQLTNYTVKVKALCGENNTSEPVEIEFATPGICPQVSDIQSSNAANTTTLTWTPGGEETAWLVQFKPAAAGDNEWISINVNSLPTTTFGGLMATTLYDVRVKALCDPADEENQSEWANHEFTSGCAAFDIPFAETFDSYNMPTCWDADGFGFSGGYAYSYDLDAWIMTPAINIPSDEATYLAFDVKGYGNFSVMASYRGTDASRFAEIYSGEIESGSNYTQVVVPMADNLKGRQVYFKIVNNADQYQYIDNLSVDYCPFVPANLTATHLTENSAVLTWECAELANNFQVEVGENIVDVEGAKTYTLTGLDASTTYTFSVRTQCGEDSYGDWSAEKTFTTPCPSVTLPYTEDFESTETYEFPTCWTIVSSTNDPYVYTSSSYSQFTTKFLGLNYAAVVATPKIAAPANQLMLNFDFTQESTTYSYCGPIEVGFTTDLSSVENITWLQTINNSTSTAVEHKTVYFNTLNTDAEGYIVFRGQSSNYLLAIDNVLVETIPTCGTPSIAVNGTTATITRSSIGEPASYDLQIGNQIETVPATQTTVDLASVFTLELNTNYEVSVRANCGEGDQSEWSQAVSFTTPECYSPCVYTLEMTDSYGDGWNGNAINLYVNNNLKGSYTISTGRTNNVTISNCEQGELEFKWSQGSYPGECSFVIKDATGQTLYTCSNASSLSTGQVLHSEYCGELPTCGVPTIAVNGTTATITPNEIGTAVSYDLQIGEEIQTVTGTTVDLASIFTLAPSTTYSVSVRANCGGGDYSEWSQAVSFMTPCAAYTVPYFEGFENGYTNGSAVAGCISQQSVSGSYSWTANTSETGYNRTPRTGSWNAYLRYSNSDWMFIPMHFEANKHYVFEMYARQNASSGCSMRVAYGTDNTSSAMTNAIVNSTNIGSSFVKLTGTFVPTATGDYYVGIYAELTSSPWYVSIDDISITEVPFCVTPSIASVVPGTNDATVTVAASEHAQSYEVVCVLHGEDIETGTPVAAEELTATITGLTPATQYDVYARAICSETETSDWSEVSTFFTECLAYTLPYFEGFENSTFAPVCWQNYHVSGPGASLWQRESYTVHNGNGSAKIPDMNATTITNLVSPALVIPQANTCKVSVWVNRNATGTAKPNEGIKVYASTTGTVDETAVELFHAHRYIGFEPVQSTTGWYEYEAMIPVSGESVYLIFQGICEYGSATYIDDITVEQVVFEKDLALNSIDPIAWACDQSDAKVTINVENAGITDTITFFEARYVINTQAPVSETVNCNLAPGEKMSYTFTTTPVFVDGENIVRAVIDMEGDMQVENNYTDPIIVSLLEPETVPYTPTLSADLVNKGWNVVDANNDGITMDINNAAIVYSFNDTLAANDWMFTPCIEMAAGSYNVYFNYKANSSLTETFEVYYGQGANVDAMTNNIAYLDFNNTDYETAMLAITVAEDGIYNFGFNAMSLAGNLGFSITNFEVYPVVNVTVTSGANGTVTPNGVVPVNYGENLNLTIVPNTMYHVAGVWVDDVQVMSEDPYNSNFMFYTLENVTEPHNVFVDYKLEYHIIKSVANYNPAYTDVPGEFIPAATDTLIDPDPVTVNFAAAPHYHLYSLEMAMMNEEDMVDVTADVVDNGDLTYSYLTPELVVANYYLRATFRRDTVAVNYLVNTGKGYADQSDVLAQGAQYATWWDYSVDNDVDAVANIRPYTTGDAHSDYHIVNVNVNGEDMGVIDTYTFENIQEDQNIAIDFGYQVTTSIRNYVDTYLGSDEVRGTIEPATQLVAEGDSTVVYGTVQEHFHLYNLFVDGVDMIDQVVFEGQNYSLTIDSTIANYNIEAVVKIDTFGIHYIVMDGQGYADESDVLVAPAEYTTWINYGDDLMMNLTPDRGFSIGNVFVDGIEMYTANNYLFEYVEEHHYVVVSFVPNDYTITTNAYGHGTVTDGMSFTYDPESPVNYQFTATAEEGYHISAIVINDATVDLTGVTDTYTQTLEDVDANYVINAIFEINTYTVDVTAHNGGTTNIQGVVSYNYGDDVNVFITADEGHYISSITIDGETTEYTQADNVTNYTQQFTSINADHSVSATFAVKHFTITAEVNEEANHGTIDGVSSFSGEFSYGSNQTFNFIPEENYQVSDVVVDGQSVGAVDSYEFVNITAEHNVVVSFAPVQYTLTATSNVPACTITPATTTVQAGSNVNYTLTVATGYHLLNVIANGEEVNVVANAFTIENVQEDYEIFANFAPNNVTVTVAQPAHATITPGTMTYAYGATPSYVIVPEAGYEVTAVHAGNALVNVTYNNGIGSFTLNPVTADITLTATTAIKTFTITATQSAHGTISPAAVQTVNYGGNVTYTITPDQFYAISDVKVDGASRGAISSYTFNNVTGNHTIEALFEAACYEPTNLTAMYITTTSAVLSWVGTAPSYEVRYRKAADANWNTQTVTVPTVTLTGLDSNTLYAWEVRAYCTAQLQSEWVANSFMTKAGAQPYDPTSIASAEFNTVKVYSHLNNVYVVNENGVAISSIAIFDINGKQVYTGSVNGSTEVISLNVANGSYIVRLASENGVGIYKVSIVR